MELIIEREKLLKPLQLITNTVDKKQVKPILSNILFKLSEQRLTLLGTDLEIELIKYVTLHEPVTVTTQLAIPAKKLHDICRTLPPQAEVHFSLQSHQLLIRSGRSRFALSLMSAADFPTLEYDGSPKYTFSLSATLLRHLLIKTHFAIAVQDVRYFLNGLFIDFHHTTVSAVATDGHRLALSSRPLDFTVAQRVSILVPRKAVLELMKLLENAEGVVDFCIGNSYVSVRTEDYCFTTKLLEGNFPEYQGLIPKLTDKVAVIDKITLHEALLRVSVLSNEKYRGAWLTFEKNRLTLQANNPDKDEVEEELSIDYTGPLVRLGCNVTYLQEVLSAINEDTIRISLAEASLVIQALASESESYVVMSMRL